MDDELVTVATFRFAHEADLARMHLEGEGIRAFVADAETVNMDWFLGNAVGYVKLQVPRSQAEAAAAVLARAPAPRSDDQSEEDEDSGATSCLSCGAEMPEWESRCPSCGWSYEGEEEP